MKHLTPFLTSLAFITLIACNPSVKEDENNKPHESSQEQTTTTTTTSSTTNGVYFANLNEGDKVKSPVVVEMGINGMEVEAAGAMNEGKGHHHIIVDGSFEPKGTMVPKDETHLHYGQGQTSDTLALTPGKHTLTLQFANGMHQSYGEEWSKTITIMVSE